MELQLLGPGFAASDHQRAHGPAVPRRSTNKEQDCHHSGNSHLVVAPVCSRKSDPTDASRCRAAARFLTRPQAGQGFAPMPTFYRRPSKSYRTKPQRRSRAVPGTNRVKARSAHGIANQATTMMIRARAATTMIDHSVTQIANGTRFRCMFGQIKRGGGVLYHTENLGRKQAGPSSAVSIVLKRGLASRYEWSSPTVTIAFYANAGQIVAEHLSKAAAGEEMTPKPPAPPSAPQQPPAPPQPVAHVQHLPPAPQLDLPAKPPDRDEIGKEFPI
jgi:hypothetical protein